MGKSVEIGVQNSNENKSVKTSIVVLQPSEKTAGSISLARQVHRFLDYQNRDENLHEEHPLSTIISHVSANERDALMKLMVWKESRFKPLGMGGLRPEHRDLLLYSVWIDLLRLTGNTDLGSENDRALIAQDLSVIVD